MAVRFYLVLFLMSIFTLCLSRETEQEPCPSTKQVYYVSKNGTDDQNCFLRPSAHPVPCASLSYLKNNVLNCSKFLILDDGIVLKGIMVFNVSSVGISIVGNRRSNQKVVVHCEGNGGLLFQNSSGVLLENFRFDGCSFNVLKYLQSMAIGSELSSNRSSIMFEATHNVHIVMCSFENHLGSAILLVNVEGTMSIKDSTFTGNDSLVSENESRSGGVVLRQSFSAQKSNISFQSCKFNLNLNMNKDTECHDDDYYDNLIRRGGAIDINLAPSSGSLMSILIADCSFTQNKALGGGAVSISFIGNDFHSNFSLLGSNFTLNSACFQGGAVLFVSDNKLIGFHSNLQGMLSPNVGYFQVESCIFTTNYAFWGGGLAAWCRNYESYLDIHFNSCTWQNNSANSSGFAVGLNGPDGAQTNEMFHITATVSGNCTFVMNRVVDNGYEAVGTVSSDNAEIVFHDGLTSFVMNVGTALLMKTVSKVRFHGDVDFLYNTGVMGGAILLQDDSYMYIDPHSKIIFNGNTAFVLGGAIYSKVSDKCVFDFGENASSSNVNVFFNNNRANDADQSVFVQDVEACNTSNHIQILLDGFKYSPHLANQVSFPLDSVKFSISPERDTLHVMLGEKFHFKSIEITDRFNRNSSGIGHLFLADISTHYSLKGPSTVSLDNYTVKSEFFIEGLQLFHNKTLRIELFFDRESTYRMGSAVVNIIVVPCRLGYRYSAWSKTCKCAADESANALIKCPMDSRTLCVKYRYWYSNTFEHAIPCPAQNCEYMYGECPSRSKMCPNSTDYCSIQHPDDVCWEGRGHLLCSLCASNYSFTLGAFECVPSSTCRNKNTILLMLALIVYWILFAMGVLLVLKLELSIGSGFMYGIVYYFSVVTIYTSSSALFSNLWLRMLILISMAMTQLDPQLLGYMFKTCFIQSWDNPLPHQLFRYVTPLFVVILILAIIFISRYFRLPKCISFVENSPIHAICMLILFSYTSLSYTNFKILIPIDIEGKHSVRIAPTVPYFHPKSHIPYAIVAICVELFISLPICFFFLFATCISRHVNLVKFRLKPILDEFQACYRPECRWFVGFYFLARQLVYLVNGILAESSPQHNSALVTVNILILIIHTSFQPYQKKWLNILDTVLLTDIVLLSISSVALSNNDQVYKVNRFIHNKALPCALILVPTFYLIGALGLIFLKRKWSILRCCCRFRKRHVARVKQSFSSIPSTTSVTINEEDGLFRAAEQPQDPYYGDDRVREPLLEENTPIDEEKRNRVYGSTSHQQSRSTTLRQFPILHKSSTN